VSIKGKKKFSLGLKNKIFISLSVGLGLIVVLTWFINSNRSFIVKLREVNNKIYASSELAGLSASQKKSLRQLMEVDDDIQELIEYAPDLINKNSIIKNAAGLSKTEAESQSKQIKDKAVLTPDTRLGSAPIPSKVRPNIVLIVADDQRYVSIERMPYMSSLAGHWYKFAQATVNVSLCCPSRSAILSGQYSHTSGVEDNLKMRFFNEKDNLATRLHDSGYKTALIGKYLNGWVSDRRAYKPEGWDEWSPFVGPPNYYNYDLLENGVKVRYGEAEIDYSTDVLGQKAVDFIQKTKHPFFLYFAPYTAHSPFIPAPRHLQADVGQIVRGKNFNEEDIADKPEWMRNLPKRDEKLMGDMLKSQYRMLLSLDEWVEKIVSVLQEKSLLENTIIIYISDNSIAFGEHRLVSKTCGHKICNHIPLFIYYPFNPVVPGRSIDIPVTNVDIAPTVAEFAGVKLSKPDGLSLVGLLKGQKSLSRKGILIRWAGLEDFYITPAFWGIVTNKWRYIELVTGEKELYSLSADPFELQNLANGPQYNQIMIQLSKDLQELKKGITK